MKRIIFILSIICIPVISIAGNMQLTQPDIKNTLTDEVAIGLRFTWEKSWYCGKNHPPFNWDAAWIFVKYRRSDSDDWFHATIKRTEKGELSQDSIPSDKKGTMVYRKKPGFGTFTDTLTIIWDRKSDFNGIDNDLKNISSEICVYAIEMVYVPEGLFFLGDGSTGVDYGVYSLSGSYDPYPVRSEASINIGTSGTNVLYRSTNNFVASSISLAEHYPKGYKSFYCMKTEITQKQYTDFLNKINPLQNKADNQQNIYSSIILDFGNNPDVLKTYGNTIVRDEYGEYSTSTPERACNFLTSLRVLAYLSWAGLRPMSPLEYEKACRGKAAPTPGEYAWGSTKSIPATGFEGTSTPDKEYYKSPSGLKSNIHISAISRGGSKETGMDIGPGRVGAFANDTSTRIMAGASYYGILDLSGGLAELVVHHWYGSPVSYHFNRNNHGTGLPLRNYTGVAAYPATWPIIPETPTHTTGYGRRGGHFMCKPSKTEDASIYDPSTGQVSAQTRLGKTGIYYGHIIDYSYGTYPDATNGKLGYYLHGYGGRGVRSF